jgi:alkaline phosphatase
MSPSHVEYGRLVEYGPAGESIIQSFGHATVVSTDSLSTGPTDSAASGTAIATGVRTTNGRIGVNHNAKMNLTSIREIAQAEGYKTGLVAACYLTHATPASFAAHNPSRNNNAEIGLDIALSGIDLLFGGGSDPKYLGNHMSLFDAAGYQQASTRDELNALTELPALALLADGHPSAEKERDDAVEPSLAELVARAIILLEQTGDPFFLMVEGSQIDWASHANDQDYLAHEVVEFEKAVRLAKTYAEAQGDVLLMVTADHDCGGLSIVSSDRLTSPLPEEGDDLATLRQKRSARAAEIDVKWSTGGHTRTKVPLVGLGPGSELIDDAVHHVDTFGIMRTVIDGEYAPVGSGFYDGFVSDLWYYSLGGMALLAILILCTRFVVKKRRN